MRLEIPAPPKTLLTQEGFQLAGASFCEKKVNCDHHPIFRENFNKSLKTPTAYPMQPGSPHPSEQGDVKAKA